MKHFQISPDQPQIDITGPEHGIQVELDGVTGVLYVHVDGVTVLRVNQVLCPVEAEFKMVERDGRHVTHSSNKIFHPATYLHDGCKLGGKWQPDPLEDGLWVCDKCGEDRD